MSAGLIAVTAYLLDSLLGEPKTRHPLILYGKYVSWLEAYLCKPEVSAQQLVLRGGVAYFFAAVLPTLVFGSLFYALSQNLQVILGIVVVYFCIAPTSLKQHALAVFRPLRENDLNAARAACAMMVSRDTTQLTPEELASATVESVVENAHDGVIAPLCWFVVFGVPGVLLFRLSNTLDAMWGYRSARYLYFGRVSARMDDLLGFITARVTVLLYGAVTCSVAAWRSARQFGPKWYSPNAGPVMAAGAGALGLKLGGPAVYAGEQKERPALGDGHAPRADDIERALSLVERSYCLLLFSLLLAGIGLNSWT